MKLNLELRKDGCIYFKDGSGQYEASHLLGLLRDFAPVGVTIDWLNSKPGDTSIEINRGLHFYPTKPILNLFVKGIASLSQFQESTQKLINDIREWDEALPTDEGEIEFV